MELLNLSRQIAGEIQSEHEQALRSTPFELRYWIARLEDCKTLESIVEALKEFHAYSCWTLVERARVSAAYTPTAVKILKSQENYQRRLDDLAELCWNHAR